MVVYFNFKGMPRLRIYSECTQVEALNKLTQEFGYNLKNILFKKIKF